MDYVAFPTNPSASDYDEQLAKWHAYQDFLKNPSTPDNEIDVPKGEGREPDEDDQDDRSESESEEPQARPFVYSAEYREGERKRIFKERYQTDEKDEAIERGRADFEAETGLGIDDIVKEKCNRTRGTGDTSKARQAKAEKREQQGDGDQGDNQEQGGNEPQEAPQGGSEDDQDPGEGEQQGEGGGEGEAESEQGGDGEGDGEGGGDDDTPQMPTCAECGEERGSTPGCCQPEEQDMPMPEPDNEHDGDPDILLMREGAGPLQGVDASARLQQEAHPEIIRVVTKTLAGVDDWTRKVVANAVTEALVQVYGDLTKVAEASKRRMNEGGGGKPSPKEVAKQVDKALAKVLPTHLATHHDAIVAEVVAKMNDVVDIEAIAIQVLEHISVPQRIVIDHGDDVEIEIEGTPHAMFLRCLEIIQRRDSNGNHRNIFLKGPSGSGKGYLAHLLATALKADMAYLSCSEGMSEGMLTGRCIPLADRVLYMTTEVVEKWENGGLIFVDEVDAANPNVLLVWNEALSSGKMALPNRLEKPYAVRHPDTYVVCAANTWGTGANLTYVGRNRLDGAFPDRFWHTEINYDPNVERSICEAYLEPAQAKRTLKEWFRIRNKINDLGMNRIWSTRALEFACIDLASGDSWEQVLAEKTVAWTPDEKSRVGVLPKDDGEVPF